MGIGGTVIAGIIFWNWMAEMSLNFYDPSVATSKFVAMARRPESLAGKTVGLFDNTKEQADIVLEALGAELVRSHGVKEAITRRGIHYSKPAPVEIVEEMARKCDIVICALGG
jgi:hypothetical protein